MGIQLQGVHLKHEALTFMFMCSYLHKVQDNMHKNQDNTHKLVQIGIMENNPMGTLNTQMFQLIPTNTSHVMNRARTTDSAPRILLLTFMANPIGHPTTDPANKKNQPKYPNTRRLTKLKQWNLHLKKSTVPSRKIQNHFQNFS